MTAMASAFLNGLLIGTALGLAIVIELQPQPSAPVVVGRIAFLGLCWVLARDRHGMATEMTMRTTTAVVAAVLCSRCHTHRPGLTPPQWLGCRRRWMVPSPPGDGGSRRHRPRHPCSDERQAAMRAGATAWLVVACPHTTAPPLTAGGR